MDSKTTTPPFAQATPLRNCASFSTFRVIRRPSLKIAFSRLTSFRYSATSCARASPALVDPRRPLSDLRGSQPLAFLHLVQLTFFLSPRQVGIENAFPAPLRDAAIPIA